jgi:hypothetical protein
MKFKKGKICLLFLFFNIVFQEANSLNGEREFPLQLSEKPFLEELIPKL